MTFSSTRRPNRPPVFDSGACRAAHWYSAVARGLRGLYARPPEACGECMHPCIPRVTPEHGLGQLKREEILRRKSPLEIELMRTLKRALDPKGLMNPGKVV